MEICFKCGSAEIIGVQYGMYRSEHQTEFGGHPQHYDGVSEYMCGNCQYRQGRWSGKELKEGEAEPVGGISS